MTDINCKRCSSDNCVKNGTVRGDAFSKILPAERHVIGKRHTISIEQDNSNTRHYLARMTRRTKVVSKSEYMVNASIKLWLAMTEPETFERVQMQFLSIFE